MKNLRPETLCAAIYENICMAPYSPEWPRMFAAGQARMLSLFPAEMLAIEHNGITAIPGMQAKPVIDLLAGLESMNVAEGLIARICEVGHTTSAEFNEPLSDRRWFMHHDVHERRSRFWRRRQSFGLRRCRRTCGTKAILGARLSPVN